ncbi:HAD family hydrolase [Oceaniglobus ichthyenteri]|uniref:HAD family hydrolase n=1 Tax=Oceaniglobus ichthyenteri TaxID=2136177 RepID=UPI000D38CE68|nr:HAD family phosphatase [Oceaniglobus ichthyenteri]
MTVQAVVFDIGNVLLEWKPEKYYDRTIGPARRKALFDQVDVIGMNERVDMGHDFTQTIYDMADAHPEWHREIRDWHDNWLQLAQPVIHRSVRLLRALRTKGVPVFALTNFGVGSFDLAKSEHDFLSEFDRTYVSGALRVVKPDARIYQIVEDDCALPPHTLLFTDDRTENISAAQTRGWQTHHFTTPQGWAERLIAAGLLSEAEAT